jgi:hypothetical protein
MTRSKKRLHPACRLDYDDSTEHAQTCPAFSLPVKRKSSCGVLRYPVSLFRCNTSTYLTGLPNFSLGCDGSRKFSGIADDEMTMGFPAEMLPEITIRVEDRCRGTRSEIKICSPGIKSGRARTCTPAPLQRPGDHIWRHPTRLLFTLHSILKSLCSYV